MTPRIQQRIRPVEPTTDDAVLIAVERRGWALLAAASLFALAFFGFDAAGGALLGGAVGLLNFRLIVQTLVEPDGTPHKLQLSTQHLNAGQ